MIEICSVGGFDEVGKNMVAVKCGDGVVICDMGIYLPALVEHGKSEDVRLLSVKELVHVGALPDDSVLDFCRQHVKAIVLSHAHLDHISAVPYLAEKYAAPVLGTAFTLEVVKSIVADTKKKFSCHYIPLDYHTPFHLGKNWNVELIPITHSTLECALIAVHTPEGCVVYANDFKLDDTPTIGRKPDYALLSSLSPRAVVCESLYSTKEGSTPSELVAQDMLHEVLLSHDFSGKALFVTSFASHVARLKAAIQFAKEINREVVILGRSFGKYVSAAEKLQLTNCFSSVTVCTYRDDVQKMLKKIAKDRGKYLVLCTGSQGEPESILDRICRGESGFHFTTGDVVIFSCRTIPHEINIKNREDLERRLTNLHVRMFKDVHVSGHSAREDLRRFLTLLKPQHVIPSHGNEKMRMGLATLCYALGYTPEYVHSTPNGSWVKL